MSDEQKVKRYWITLLEHKNLQHLVNADPIIDDGEKKVLQSTPSDFPHGIRVNGVEYHAVEITRELGELVAYVYDPNQAKRIVRLGAISLTAS